MDMKKTLAEVDILRAFIDFVNKQVGVYCDCLASFEGNKVRIERQKGITVTVHSIALRERQIKCTVTVIQLGFAPDVPQYAPINRSISI